MTNDKTSHSRHKPGDGADEQPETPSKSDKATDEKFKIAENVARWALTKIYDDLFMPSQFKDASGSTAKKATDKTAGKTTPKEEQKLAQGNISSKNDRQNGQKSETPIPIPNLSDSRFMGHMSWMNTIHDQFRGGIANTSKFIGGKADAAGNSLDQSAASIGIPKPVRDATKATNEFAKHFAGTFVSDAYEMSKLVYNPEDPAVRLAQSWGGMDTAMRMSVLRSGQNLVSGVLALGSKTADELGKRGYVENPAKALYLGNRDLSINTSLEMGKWLAKAKPADWGSLSGHAATFVIGGTEITAGAMAGTKAIKTLAQGTKLGKASAVIKESEQLSKAGKTTANTLDGTAGDAGENLSKSQAEKETLPSQKKSTEDLPRYEKLEEAKNAHKELNNQLWQKQQELEKIKDKHDLVEEVLQEQTDWLGRMQEQLHELGDFRKMPKACEEEIAIQLEQFESIPVVSCATVFDRVQGTHILQILDKLVPEHTCGILDIQTYLNQSWIDKAVKVKTDDVKRALDHLGIDYKKTPDFARNFLQATKNLAEDSTHQTQTFKKINQPLSREIRDSSQLERLNDNMRLLHKRLKEADRQIEEYRQDLKTKEEFLAEQNVVADLTEERLKKARFESFSKEITFDYDTIPKDWNTLSMAAITERADTGTIIEAGLLKLNSGTTLEVSAADIVIREEIGQQKNIFHYEFPTNMIRSLGSAKDLTLTEYIRMNTLLKQNQLSIYMERLKLIAEKLEIDWRSGGTIPEDYYSF